MPHLFHFSLHTLHRHDQFNEVFISRTIRAFGVSFVAFFIPFYIVETYGGNIEAAFPLIMLYYAIFYGVKTASFYPATKAISTLGTKLTLVVSGFINIAFLTTLIFIEHSTVWLVMGGVLNGINSSLFFPAQHAHFSMSTKKDKSASQVSNIMIMRKVAMSLGPLAGGVIAAVYGFEFALIAAILLILISFLPLDLRHDIHLESFNFNDFKKSINLKHYRANFGLGAQSVVVLMAWPLFISLLIGSYDGVGLVVTASLILSIVVMHLSGIHATNESERRQIRTGSKSSAGVHLLRAGASTSVLVGVVNFMNDIAYSMIVIPFLDSYYRKARNSKKTLAYISGMEIAHGIGLLTVILLAYVIFLATSAQVALISTFIIGAIAVMFISQIVDS